MPELKRLFLSRVVAKPEALDKLSLGDSRSFRVAPDELFTEKSISKQDVADKYAIVTQEASMSGVWLSESEALHFLEHECPWILPTERPAFAQGAVAHLPVKLYFEEGSVLFMTSAPFAEDLQNRLEGFMS